MDNTWKDLDIADIPSDFFVNDRYEMAVLNGDEWVTVEESWTIRLEMIREMLFRKGFKYRYRLKPLEGIRISQHELDILCDVFSTDSNDRNIFYLSKCINRPVELID